MIKRKAWLVVLLSSVVLSGCSLVPQRSGVEIMTYPPAKVFIGGKESGMTPYKNNSLKPGEVEIRLVASGANAGEWKRKIRLENLANTVIDWEFGAEGNMGGYVLYLEKTGDENKCGLIVNNLQDRAAVTIDGEMKGYSPLKIDNIDEGDKQITISHPGLQSKNVFVKGIKGFRLVIESELAIDNGGQQPAGENLEAKTASDSASTSSGKMVVIKQTETGWLRVRQEADGNSQEIVKVKPKDQFKLLEEKDGWYRIELPGQITSGWISAKYADKLE